MLVIYFPTSLMSQKQFTKSWMEMRCINGEKTYWDELFITYWQIILFHIASYIFLDCKTERKLKKGKMSNHFDRIY